MEIKNQVLRKIVSPLYFYLYGIQQCFLVLTATAYVKSTSTICFFFLPSKPSKCS